MTGLILNEEGKAWLRRKMGKNIIDTPNFQEALDDLCAQMLLTKGAISEEGSMTTCPVHYSLTNKNGFYATQVVGTVVGTPEEVVCYLMVVHTLPNLKSKNRAHTGRWSQHLQSWEFSDE